MRTNHSTLVSLDLRYENEASTASPPSQVIRDEGIDLITVGFTPGNMESLLAIKGQTRKSANQWPALPEKSSGASQAGQADLQVSGEQISIG